MSSFTKTLDFKLAGTLFGILLVAFLIMIFSFQPSLTVKTVGIVLFCFFFVMGSVGIVFNILFFKPLKELNTSLQNSVKGDDRDLTVRMALNREDEVGTLSNSFDLFVSNLDGIIMGIGAKTETIAASSSEVSVASEQMDKESSDLYLRSNSVASAAEEMNASMHTVAAASEEASTNIGMVAEAAVQMQSNISSVAQNCDEAREVSNNAKIQVDHATHKVETLGEAAKEITNVTQVITDIAEQTKLLALNATIEAARAGEAGKGFAVVASEIKSLAAQTAEATQSIQEKIESIQNSTNDTVEQVGNISQVITSVDDIVNEIGKSIAEQSSTASEVATNIEQASIGIAEVNENVAQSSQVASEIASEIAEVDGIASDMSDRANKMSSGASDLDTLSKDLRQMISVFRVSGKTTPASASNLTEADIPDLMPWGPNLEIGVPDVDSQHQELIRLINSLHKAMRIQKGAAEVGKILGDLKDYTVYHFGFEEEMFDKYGYPETLAHKKIHAELVGQVSDFHSQFQEGKATVSMDLMDFLKDWLKSHILKTDVAYVPFINDKLKTDKV